MNPHIVVKSFPAYLGGEQITVDIERTCLAFLFRGEVYQLRQLHDLTSVEGNLPGMVYKSVAPDLSIPVLLEEHVNPKPGLQYVDKLLYLLLILCTQRLALAVEYLPDVGVDLFGDGLSLTSLCLLRLRFGDFPLRYLILIFLDNGLQLSCPVLAFTAFLSPVAEYVAV